jgi:parallel beta-helix repeat protein
MNKKIIGIIVSILLIFSAVSSVNGTELVEKNSMIIFCDRNILYVGDSANYKKIQDAIDDAVDGDTVFVYNGTYNELISINTSIDLIGEDKDTTIINGSEIGVVVTINSDYVNISGFTIKKSNFYKYAVAVKSDYNNISNNIIIENGYGIYIVGFDNNIITGNTFSHHYYRCIYTEYSDNNLISGNHFHDNNGKGIFISYSNFSIISDNYITRISDGIYTVHCNNLIINNNSLIDETYDTAIHLSYTNYSKISSNIILSWEWGLRLDNSNYNNIYGNKITDCYSYGILCYSENNFNDILYNVFSNNGNGIYIWEFSCSNIIICNNFSSNNYGINIKYMTSCNNNIIYHNNFINNSANARDGCINIWNNSYPAEGNFWDDYTGEDNNGDGIGDTPYNISGESSNQDLYPLMHLFGPPYAEFKYDNETLELNASMSGDYNGDIVSYEWDFGDGTTGYGEIIYHKYCDIGMYDVTLIVTDDYGLKGNITKSVDVVLTNIPPTIPKIYGPISGRPGIKYEYIIIWTDPDDACYLWIDWGDGDSTGWMGPLGSGDPVNISHKWNQSGTYIIKAKLKDFCNESPWGMLEVTMPRNKAINTPFLQFIQNFLQNHPNLFPILQKIIQRLRLQ